MRFGICQIQIRTNSHLVRTCHSGGHLLLTAKRARQRQARLPFDINLYRRSLRYRFLRNDTWAPPPVRRWGTSGPQRGALPAPTSTPQTPTSWGHIGAYPRPLVRVGWPANTPLDRLAHTRSSASADAYMLPWVGSLACARLHRYVNSPALTPLHRLAHMRSLGSKRHTPGSACAFYFAFISLSFALTLLSFASTS